MAFLVPVDFSTGRLVSAPDWNAEMGTSGNMSMTAVALASAAGQMPYATGTNALAMLTIGSANKVLTSSGTAPQWSTQTGAIGLTTTGDLPYASSATAMGRLAIGSTNAVLQVVGGLPAWVTAPTIPGLLTHGLTGNVFTTSNAGTAAVYGTFVNTGGTFYVGADNSTGAGIAHSGGVNYAGVVHSDVALIYGAGSVYRWQINNSGHQLALTDNSYDIGASGATRPRSIYVGTKVRIGGVDLTEGTVIASSALALSPGGLTSASGFLGINAASTSIDFLIANTTYAFLTTTAFQPFTDSTSAGTGIDLGTSSKHWRDAYVWRAAFNGSLRDSKRNARLIDRAAALRVARSTQIRRYQYKPGGPDDVNAERWHIGFYADDAHEWLSDDHKHASPGTTASLALAAIAGEADAREADVAALRREVASLRAELNRRKN